VGGPRKRLLKGVSFLENCEERSSGNRQRREEQSFMRESASGKKSPRDGVFERTTSYKKYSRGGYSRGGIDTLRGWRKDFYNMRSSKPPALQDSENREAR